MKEQKNKSRWCVIATSWYCRKPTSKWTVVPSLPRTDRETIINTDTRQNAKLAKTLFMPTTSMSRENVFLVFFICGCVSLRWRQTQQAMQWLVPHVVSILSLALMESFYSKTTIDFSTSCIGYESLKNRSRNLYLQSIFNVQYDFECPRGQRDKASVSEDYTFESLRGSSRTESYEKSHVMPPKSIDHWLCLSSFWYVMIRMPYDRILW